MSAGLWTLLAVVALGAWGWGYLQGERTERRFRASWAAQRRELERQRLEEQAADLAKVRELFPARRDLERYVDSDSVSSGTTCSLGCGIKPDGTCHRPDCWRHRGA